MASADAGTVPVPLTRPVAVVTGASSGIGAATARRLAAEGYHVVVGARRQERVEALATEIGGTPLVLDVTDQVGVDTLAAVVAELPGPLKVLVNNAGGARGLASVRDAVEDDWRWMYEVNVLGTLRVTRALLPALVAGQGHIVMIGSVAGYEVYEGGGGYTAAKHAESALARTLRLELLDRPVRVTEVCPGLVETEFSLVRFDGDAERAAGVYAGVEPLVADDIADAVAWAVTRRPVVNVDRIDIKPQAQASATRVHRRLAD
jgi:NADP-dependent 3-hydroxy acid dehydrogenase YdfG